MFFLTPRYVKYGRQFVKDARKLVSYKRDLVSEATIADVEREIAHLEHAIAERDERKVNEQMDRLNTVCGQMTKPHKDAAIRENVEVFLVAIVIALAVRTYFLQPFTIPTGSMQPTLNGILGYVTTEPPPNIAQRVLEYAALGREYVNIVAQQDERIVSVHEETRPGLRRIFTYTRIDTDAGNTYWVHGGETTVSEMIGGHTSAKAGEPLLRGYIETGDHVFVDKMTYHFRRPERGEVFVFSTSGLPTDGREYKPKSEPSQYYIKRLVGLPNDTLRVDAPNLYVNGKPAEEPGMKRVMSGTYASQPGTYRGYSNMNMGPRRLLATPDDQFTVPSTDESGKPNLHYFAMGDNSYRSSDSRAWGPVPQENVMGRAIFVYWPFTRHWSLIR